jgi:acyl-CoA synthetase (AMP-forming)/AMP-acid ligase II
MPGIESSESLTWSRVHRGAQVVAAELATCGSPGDRVAILAPQGFEYIVGALGAVGCSPNDIDTFDAEFVEISPINEIRSKGRAGV